MQRYVVELADEKTFPGTAALAITALLWPGAGHLKTQAGLAEIKAFLLEMATEPLSEKSASLYPANEELKLAKSTPAVQRSLRDLDSLTKKIIAEDEKAIKSEQKASQISKIVKKPKVSAKKAASSQKQISSDGAK